MLKRKVLGTLRVLAGECSAPGWDGYGAAPVTQETHEQARRFAMALPIGTSLPSVGAEPDGHLTLEWYRGPNRVLSVSVSSEGTICYAALLGSSKQSGTESFTGEVPEDILQIIRDHFSA